MRVDGVLAVVVEWLVVRRAEKDRDGGPLYLGAFEKLQFTTRTELVICGGPCVKEWNPAWKARLREGQARAEDLTLAD